MRVSELNAKTATLEAELAAKTAELAAKDAQISELQTRLDESRRNPKTINNYINIVAFGQEAVPDTREVLKLLKRPETSVAKYIEMKHFRDPSMSNVRLRGKRAKTMQVVEPDVNSKLRWTVKDKTSMLHDLAEKNLEELVETHGAERNDRWKKWYRQMPEEGYDKTDQWSGIENSVENMLVTHMPENLVE